MIDSHYLWTNFTMFFRLAHRETATKERQVSASSRGLDYFDTTELHTNSR
jgi:hypothetical protein